MKTKKSAVEFIRVLEKNWLGRMLLLPLTLASYLFCLLTGLRTYLYKLKLLKAEELKCRVICVGNITSGGTGKTPAVRLLAGKLRQEGLRVAIISRGYKGSLGGRLEVVADEQQVMRSAAEVGDEPHLLARQLPGVPVIVGKQRYRAGQYAYLRFNPQVIILDDGYQHLKLARQVNIVLIDATCPFGNHYLLPRGTLREPLAALSRAQVFLLTKTDLVEDTSSIISTLKRYNPSAPVITSIHQPVGLSGPGGNNSQPLEWLKGKKVVCFCGIGEPASFGKLLRNLGAEILEQVNFPDHYSYTQNDLKRLEERAMELGAEALITTEKDGVRLSDYTPGSLPLMLLGIELKITADKREWEKAWGMIVGEQNAQH
jgi:tetraacyldisaccharide 4'-kinase